MKKSVLVLALAALALGAAAQTHPAQRYVDRLAAEEPLHSAAWGVVARNSSGETLVSLNPDQKLAPASNMKDGRKVEWRLVPDPGRTNETVLVMKEVDVETGLPWEEYQAKAKAEAEAKAKKIAEEALAKAEVERKAKEQEEKEERLRVRSAEDAQKKTLEATKKQKPESAPAKPKKTVEEAKKAVKESVSKGSDGTTAVKKTVKKPATPTKGGSSRSDVKMESSAPEKAEEK